MNAPSGDEYVRTGFLERIAHELRGPSGVTLGALDELELVLGGDSARVAALLVMARRSIQRLLRTAERLQRTAELEGGQVDWAREPRDLRDLVRAALQAAELLEARKGIAVVVALPDTPCPALVDGPWVTSAITELLLNAIRNAHSVASVNLSRGDGASQIVITDDGAGFSGPVPKRFTPSARRQGLGLSLSLVNDVAEAHGATLSIDATEAAPPATGTRVHLKFPGMPAAT